MCMCRSWYTSIQDFLRTNGVIRNHRWRRRRVRWKYNETKSLIVTLASEQANWCSCKLAANVMKNEYDIWSRSWKRYNSKHCHGLTSRCHSISYFLVDRLRYALSEVCVCVHYRLQSPHIRRKLWIFFPRVLASRKKWPSVWGVILIKIT